MNEFKGVDWPGPDTLKGGVYAFHLHFIPSMEALSFECLLNFLMGPRKGCLRQRKVKPK